MGDNVPLVAANSEQQGRTATIASNPPPTPLARRLFAILGLAALAYSFLAGLHTLIDFDLGWQLATGRWIAQHHRISSTDVFSYTAQGQPWIYPVGSGLLFYLLYRIGNYALLSYLGAVVCTGTTALLLRSKTMVSAVLAIFAIPLIAARTSPRADMFTVVIFAAFLTLLWQQHETGHAALWILPLLMIAWVNLHLGFLAGLALLGGYVLVEVLEMVWPDRLHAAAGRLQRSWPWLVATIGATLVNPWGWGIYRALFRQQTSMAFHSESIKEWASARLNWALVSAIVSLRDPDPFLLMLLVAAIAVPLAIWRRRLGATALLAGAAVLAYRHIRFQALFALVTVVVAGAVLTSGIGALRNRIEDARLPSILALGMTALVLMLVGIRSADLVTNRAYLGATYTGSFGAGLSWWFPEGAAAFIDREKIPGQIFNNYNEGGYVTWRLGPKYLDYIDGRAIPFGAELFYRSGTLLLTPPESPEWQREAERYNLNAILVPLARYDALEFFPVLRQFCASDTWRPVYLDEVSIVFLRRRPETENLVQRLQIDCATAPLPVLIPRDNSSNAFNQWANAAAVLHALGRNDEALSATTRALAIFQDSAFVHFLRGNLFEDAGNLRDAEQQYLLAAGLEPNAATWSALAALYHREGKQASEIDAWEHAIDLLPKTGLALLSLGYADLDAHRPREALNAFERAIAGLPSPAPTSGDNSFFANVAHGRALAWSALGNLQRAISFEEETVRLAPDRSDDWIYLANLYDQAGRPEDARKAREHAATNQPLNLKP
ncbi:MAG: tetratricopeptide repeat protein [Terriglobales bacterium]|jgi:tetratricopeptide (TPR) repeat protein